MSHYSVTSILWGAGRGGREGVKAIFKSVKVLEAKEYCVGRAGLHENHCLSSSASPSLLLPLVLSPYCI